MTFLLRSTLSLVLALFIMFAGTCGDVDYSQATIMDHTGVNIGDIELIESVDSHDGMLFDGASLDVFACDPRCFAAIEGDWRPLPLNINLNRLVYGDMRDPEVEVPVIESGSYLFFDRHPDATEPGDDGPLFKRSSINISLFIYDETQQKLYYYEYDS